MLILKKRISGFIGAILGLGAELGSTVGLIHILSMIIPIIVVSVRRMHDIGRSEWWIFVPVVGFIFLFLNSELGENKYGPNPKRA